MKPLDGSFTLGHYEAGTRDTARETTSLFDKHVKNYGSSTFPLSGLQGSPLSEHRPDGVVRLGSTSRRGTSTVLNFTIQGTPGQPDASRPGTAEYDSDGLLTRLEVKGIDNFVGTRTYNLKHPDGGPFIDRSEFKYRWGPPPFGMISVATYKLNSSPVPGDHEFYMAHYGLPEPVGGIAPVGPLSLWWYLGIAAGCVALAYLCYRLARRRGRRGEVVVSPPNAAA